MIRTLLRSLRHALRAHIDPTYCPVLLQRPAPWRPEFDGFVKGVDNVHIDVRLSPRFIARVRQLMDRLLDQQMGGKAWGREATGPARGEWEEFRTMYGAIVEGALHRAKASRQPAVLALAQFSVVKFLLKAVQQDLDRRRQTWRSSLGTVTGPAGAGRLQLAERLAWLARNRGRLHYEVMRRFSEQMAQVEGGPLRERRMSLLGPSEIVPEMVLFNPLLQAEAPTDDDVLMKHYVLLSSEMEHPFSFDALEEFLPTMFRRASPVHPAEVALADAEEQLATATAELNRRRRKRAGDRDATLEKNVEAAKAALARARAQYAEVFYAWADSPANADMVFGSQQRERWQRRLAGVVEDAFERRGLLRYVAAAYAVIALEKEYGATLSGQDLFRFLSGQANRQDMLKRLQERSADKKPQSIATLVRVQKSVSRLSRRKTHECLLQFLHDYATYRRDMACYRAATQAMSLIRILEDPDTVRLSGTNGTLHEFLLPEEDAAVARTIRGHVVVKADVRGSTTMIAELRRRGLNPASHFSLNFFDPIRQLLDLYGARMVFIEGDAVILSLMEDDGTPEAPVTVARACGLARELLLVVDRQNADCRRNGLPELEVGIGVVYSDEAPSYLYAGETPIMVSPAIGKADRLSSCSWLLRKQRGAGQTGNVAVYEIPEGDPLYGEKGATHLRYNVNGIELDGQAFEKLKFEIALRRVDVTLPGEDRPGPCHVGRYVDVPGAMHTLVVRERPIHEFSRGIESNGKMTSGVFYEVIADDARLQAVLGGANVG